MHRFENTVPTVDAQESAAQETADTLDQIAAVYSLEVQKHRLLIQQARQSLFRSSKSFHQSESATEPDFVIRSRRAA